MEVVKSSLGYGKPPWIFKGRAFYQLHLVKAETARVFIPKELKLVEAFGYTLGGFFLASYDESPAGAFDELVVMPGLVMKRPGLTFGAWASKVLVNSDEACSHGQEEFGLPSQVARFSQQMTTKAKQTRGKSNGLLNMMRRTSTLSTQEDQMDIRVTEIKGSAASDIFSISLMTPASVPGLNYSKKTDPPIRMSLPNFSGRTKYNPNLLNYSCHIECRLRAVKPARISGNDLEEYSKEGISSMDPKNGNHVETGPNLSLSMMSSKPILALVFNSMRMQVEAPNVVSQMSIDSLLE